MLQQQQQQPQQHRQQQQRHRRQQQKQVVTGSQPEQQQQLSNIIIGIIIRNRLFFLFLFCAALFLVIVVSSSFTHIIRPFRSQSLASCLILFWPNISISLAFQFSSVQVRVSSGLSFVLTRRSSWSSSCRIRPGLLTNWQDNMLLCCFGYCEVVF